MPTPRDSIDEGSFPLASSTHTSCPPENIDRPGLWSENVLGVWEYAIADVTTRPSPSRRTSGENERENISSMETCTESADARLADRPAAEKDPKDPEEVQSAALESPQSTTEEQSEPAQVRTSATLSSALDLPLSRRYGISSTRLIQTHSSCKLRAGSRYLGTQTSDLHRYKVQVDVKCVDMAESFICGYLRIEGLTPEYSTLTTYFEGEIIGPRYTFQTRHESWGASEKDDMKHWGHFAAWKPLAKQAKKVDFHYKHSENRENMFMRWKEQFLVPDHRVKEITGASFEGFYYICFNQVDGRISGIYYHSKSDQSSNNKIQNLELDWVPDKGCYAATEFR